MCVCACVRACVRACVCVAMSCVRTYVRVFVCVIYVYVPSSLMFCFCAPDLVVIVDLFFDTR